MKWTPFFVLISMVSAISCTTPQKMASQPGPNPNRAPSSEYDLLPAGTIFTLNSRLNLEKRNLCPECNENIFINGEAMTWAEARRTHLHPDSDVGNGGIVAMAPGEVWCTVGASSHPDERISLEPESYVSTAPVALRPEMMNSSFYVDLTAVKPPSIKHITIRCEGALGQGLTIPDVKKGLGKYITIVPK